MVLQTQIVPFFGMYQIKFLQYHRRQLHVQRFQKGGKRKQYGTTVSLSFQRGSTVKYKNNICYVGGTKKDRITIHNIKTGKRITEGAKQEKVYLLYVRKYITTINKII